jgi:hypothetical protein
MWEGLHMTEPAPMGDERIAVRRARSRESGSLFEVDPKIRATYYISPFTTTSGRLAPSAAYYASLLREHMMPKAA